MYLQSSIVNYFKEDFYWNILLQGGFLSICLIAGFYILFTNHNKTFEQRDGKFELFIYLEQIEDYVINIYRVITGKGEVTIGSDDSINKKEVKKNGIKVKRTIRLFPRGTSILSFIVGFILVFTLGTIGNVIADDWMDMGPSSHLGLKRLWIPKNDQLVKTDETLKIQIFDAIYDEYAAIEESKKLQIYYDIKHQLLKDSLWREYIGYTQNFISLSQVFALGFFVLVLLLELNLIILGVRLIYLDKGRFKGSFRRIIFGLLFFSFVYTLFGNRIMNQEDTSWSVHFLLPTFILITFYVFEWPRHKMIPSYLFLMFALLGYWGAASSWYKNEKEVCQKTYGVFKSIEPGIRNRDLDVIRDRPANSLGLVKESK